MKVGSGQCEEGSESGQTRTMPGQIWVAQEGSVSTGLKEQYQIKARTRAAPVEDIDEYPIGQAMTDRVLMPPVCLSLELEPCLIESFKSVKPSDE